MSLAHSPNIVRNGLIFCIDAKNINSYPGVGSAITDIVSGSSATIYGNPGFSNGTLTFIGNGTQYINSSRADIKDGSWSYSTLTACAWIYIDPASSATDNNIATVENAWEYRFVNNGDGTAAVAYASNPWAWYGAGTVNTGVWQMITFRHGTATGDLWKNDSQIFSRNISGPVGAGTGYGVMTLMGRTGGWGAPANGKLAAFYLYGRAISDQEIQKNFNALRGRFGI